MINSSKDRVRVKYREIDRYLQLIRYYDTNFDSDNNDVCCRTQRKRIRINIKLQEQFHFIGIYILWPFFLKEFTNSAMPPPFTTLILQII